MVRGAFERPLWRQVRVLPHNSSRQRLPPASAVLWGCGRAREATAGLQGLPETGAGELWELMGGSGAGGGGASPGSGGLAVVDVRTAEEQAVSMLPGPCTMTEGEFRAREAELQGARVVTYCTVGLRAGRLAKKLREEGWDASNLAGSILGWTHAGLPLERRTRDGGRKPTREVHTFGAQWAHAAPGYTQTWFRRPVTNLVLGGLKRAVFGRR